jgi:hypothetical protein
MIAAGHRRKHAIIKYHEVNDHTDTPMTTVRNTAEFDVESLESASNVMLLAPSLGVAGTTECGELLTVERPDAENVLAVLLNDSPDDWIERWQRTVGPELPAQTAFVTANETARSAATSADVTRALPGPMNLLPVSSPGDLTGLGMRISQQLSEWANENHQVVVDFDSLTTLLEYEDRRSVFEFMHVLKGRIEATDAVAHYHMDPTAHDAEEVNTFKSLMDAVVEVDEDGAFSLSSR